MIWPLKRFKVGDIIQQYTKLGFGVTGPKYEVLDVESRFLLVREVGATKKQLLYSGSTHMKFKKV